MEPSGTVDVPPPPNYYYGRVTAYLDFALKMRSNYYYAANNINLAVKFSMVVLKSMFSIS